MQRGFTLIEVILSFFIISIVLITLVNLTPMSQYMARKGENLMFADQLAVNMMARARVTRFDRLVIGTDPFADENPPVVNGAITFLRSTEVRPAPVSQGTATRELDTDVAREVVVTVQWEERGRLRQRTPNTVKIQYAIQVLNVPR